MATCTLLPRARLCLPSRDDAEQGGRVGGPPEHGSCDDHGDQRPGGDGRARPCRLVWPLYNTIFLNSFCRGFVAFVYSVKVGGCGPGPPPRVPTSGTPAQRALAGAHVCVVSARPMWLAPGRRGEATRGASGGQGPPVPTIPRSSPTPWSLRTSNLEPESGPEEATALNAAQPDGASGQGEAQSWAGATPGCSEGAEGRGRTWRPQKGQAPGPRPAQAPGRGTGSQVGVKGRARQGDPGDSRPEGARGSPRVRGECAAHVAGPRKARGGHTWCQRRAGSPCAHHPQKLSYPLEPPHIEFGTRVWARGSHCPERCSA